MTISSADKRASYTAGGASSFAFSWRILEAADLLVITRTTGGVETTRILNTDYTVSGVGNDAGGTVVFGSPPTSTDSVVIILNPALTQLLDYSALGAFPAAAHEEGLDRAVNNDKRTRDLVERSLSLTDGSESGSGEYDAHSNRIVNLAAPVDVTDAATKAFVQAEILALQIDPSISVPTYMTTLLDDETAQDARNTLGVGGIGNTIFQADDLTPVDPALGISSRLRQFFIAGTSTTSMRADLEIEQQVPMPNVLDNSDFQVAQWGKSFSSGTPYSGANNDNVYTYDQWKLLSDGNGVVTIAPSTVNDVPTRAKGGIVVTQVTPDTKWGILQYIESNKSEPLGGKQVSLSVWVKAPGAITDFTISLMEWTGSADAFSGITPDPISAWGTLAGAVTAAGDWNFIAGGSANKVATTSWVRYKLENITVPSSPNNLAVLIRSNDDALPAAATLHISAVKLEVGAVATVYESKDYNVELLNAQRYYRQTFPIGTYPVENVGSITGALTAHTVTDGTGQRWVTADWRFGVPMRTAPTLVRYNPLAADNLWRKPTGTADSKFSTEATVDANHAFIGSDSTLNEIGTYYIHASASARL